jgi:hypothetical protein
MVIELVDGPAKGVIHEVQKGWPEPDRFAIPSALFPNIKYWYEVNHKTHTAHFVEEEHRIPFKS